ncbi:hypothetical protein F5887DRAFT_1082435 [Amanita rubescens]|nr:hypothetical protein F5887DRAFT_1082435 [Amanita rubescens]
MTLNLFSLCQNSPHLLVRPAANVLRIGGKVSIIGLGLPRVSGCRFEATADLIAHAREEEEQARERGDGKLTSPRMDMQGSLPVSYRPEMDWNCNENKDERDEDGSRTSRRSLPPSTVDSIAM